MAYEKGDNKSIVIALGGNALGNTPREMEERVANTARQIVDLVESGNNVLVCHGNGPQVGMIANAFGVEVRRTATSLRCLFLFAVP